MSSMWVDRAYVGLLPDASKFVPEANRAITSALNQVQQTTDRAVDGIVRSFRRIDTEAAQAFERVVLHSRDAAGDTGVYFDVAAERINRSLDAVGDGAFLGLEGRAERVADGIERDFEQAGRGSDRALDRVDQPGRFRGVGVQAEREADRVSRAFRGASVSASASLGGLRARAFGAGSVIAAALGAIGTAAVTMGLQSAASMEQAQISFEELLGSGRRARSFLAELNDFAARTPFELPGLIENARALLGAGQAAKDVIPILRALGDASGALGLSQDQYNRILIAVTQSMNKGKVQAEELMQITEAGLPVWQELSKATGEPIPKLQELMQKGDLLSKDVLPALFAQLHKDYGGSMARQAQTLNGLWSTFMDTIRNSLRDGLEPLIPVLKDILPAAGERLGGAIRTISGFFQDDLRPELGRVRQAWDDNGSAILGLVTHMADGERQMDSSKTAAQSLADSLVVLTNALGDLARLGDEAAHGLNVIEETSDRWGASIHDNVVRPANNAVKSVGEWLGVNQLVGLIARDVTADLRDLGVTFGQNTAATREGTTAAEDHAAALRREKQASQDLKDALDSEHQAELNVRQAKLDVQRAQARLTELRRDGRTKTLDYRQAEINLERAQAVLKLTTANYNQTLTTTRERERNAASASDSLRAAQRRLDLATEGAARAAAGFGRDWERTIDKLKSKDIKIKANYSTTAPTGLELLVEKGLVRKAQGGALRGPGTTTSDDILMWGSDQEHMVEAQAVKGLGGGDYVRGHQLLAQLRKLWKGQVQRVVDPEAMPAFAVGGPVLRYSQPGTKGFLARPPRFDANLDKIIDASAVGFRESLALNLTGGGGAGFGAGSWRRAISELISDHVAYQITSTFRRGARTHASGSVSFHALNRAVDLDGPNKLAIWRSLTDTNPTELIYSAAPLYKSRSGWHPISRLDPITRGDHWSHVHAAYDGGGYLPPGRTWSWNGTGSRERVLDPAETRIWERLEDTLAISTRPLPAAPATEIRVEAGAVTIDARGATAADASRIRASVEDGLYAVLREFRTGSRP